LAEDRGLIFVGGAAHSGASLVARLLAAHPGLAAIPPAVRFQSDERGMPALLAGQIVPDQFASQLQGRWWDGDGGLGEVVDRAVLERELERFRGDYHRDPLAACRALFGALVAPLGDRPGLVDRSPGNLRQAQALVRLFPGARFVHVVRDGRDVAAAPEAGEGSLSAGIRAWAATLREIDAAIRGEEDGAAHPLPAGSLAVVVLDRLIAGEWGAPYRSLLESLSLEDDPGMRAAFERELDRHRVERGRWRRRARGPAGWAVERRYRRTLAELDREGNHAARPLVDALEALG
jgi:Sulfotransferase family